MLYLLVSEYSMSTIITFIICSVLLIGKFVSCYVVIEILNTDPLKKKPETTVFIWIDWLYACVDWGVSEMPFMIWLFKCYKLYLWRNNINDIDIVESGIKHHKSILWRKQCVFTKNIPGKLLQQNNN